MRGLLLTCIALATIAAGTAFVAAGRQWRDYRTLVESDKLVAEAQELSGEGRPDRAREKVEEALTVAPRNPRAHRERAMHLIARGRLQEAARELSIAAKSLPQDAGAAREAAALYAVLGEHREAVEWLRRAVKAYRYDALAYTMLAENLLATEEVEEALNAAEKAVEIAPKIPEAQRTLGLARWRSGDAAGAVSALEESLRLRRDDLGALVSLGSVLLELDRTKEAAGYLERAAAVAPDNQAVRKLVEATRRRRAGGDELR